MTNEDSWEKFIAGLVPIEYKKLEKLYDESFAEVYEKVIPFVSTYHRKRGIVQVTESISIFNMHAQIVGIAIDKKWITKHERYDTVIAKELSQSK